MPLQPTRSVVARGLQSRSAPLSDSEQIWRLLKHGSWSLLLALGVVIASQIVRIAWGDVFAWVFVMFVITAVLFTKGRRGGREAGVADKNQTDR
jgi:hypothetical protein